MVLLFEIAGNSSGLDDFDGVGPDAGRIRPSMKLSWDLATEEQHNCNSEPLKLFMKLK